MALLPNETCNWRHPMPFRHPVCQLSYVCAVTWSYVRYDPFICVCARHICDMAHSYVNHDSFICVPRLIYTCVYVWHDLFKRLQTCDMIYMNVWHDSFVLVTWLIHMCDMTHQYDSFICATGHGVFIRVRRPIACAIRLMHTFDMTHSYVYMTHSYVWHDSSILVIRLIRTRGIICWYTIHDAIKRIAPSANTPTRPHTMNLQPSKSVSISMCIHANTRPCSHIHMHTHIHTHTYTHTYTHTHTRTHSAPTASTSKEAATNGSVAGGAGGAAAASSKSEGERSRKKESQNRKALDSDSSSEEEEQNKKKANTSGKTKGGVEGAPTPKQKEEEVTEKTQQEKKKELDEHVRSICKQLPENGVCVVLGTSADLTAIGDMRWVIALSCRTHELVTSHMYESGTSHIRLRQLHPYAWVISYIWMSGGHVSRSDGD